jgi:integrase
MGVKVKERDGAWWIYICHKGKRRAKRVGTEKAAPEAAKKIEAKLTLGDFKIEKPKPKAATFQEYAERWLELPHDWKESTQETYDANLRLHIYPVLGKERLDQIGRKELRTFFDGLTVKGLSPASIGVVRAVVSSIIVHALEQELIPANPLQDIKTRTKRKNSEEEINPLTEQEAFTVLEQARAYQGGLFYPVLLCALRTGMRVGELEALQWGDVDFAGGFIDVKRSHRRHRVTGTKTGQRKRVDMSPHLTETLKALKGSRKVLSLAGDEYVFADERGGMLPRHRVATALRSCLDKAGIRQIRVHDLRHSYATIRLLKGHNVVDVSRQLGHTNPTITLKVYAHWVPGKFKSQVAELDTPQPAATPAQPSYSENCRISAKTTG